MPSVLILSQYYPPETGAPQNRLSSLAGHLKALGMEVAVLTAMPNYPAMKIQQGYTGKWYVEEEMNGIPVHRAWIYVKKSNSIIVRLLNYFSFVCSAIFIALFRIKKYDIVICESPPLFLGITALAIKLFKHSKIVFNVSDLWPESAEKLGIVTNKVFLKMAYWLEAWLYKRSVLVTGQTQGITNSIARRYPLVETMWLPNGIDTAQYNNDKVTANWRSNNGYATNDFIVLYAGILGHAQALEVILKAALLLKEDKSIKFVLVGDGPQKEYLIDLKEKWQLDNLTIYPNQPAAAMPDIIDAIDTAVVPLKNIPLFKGAIPSKIFENLAFAKPILLGVDGEARALFIDEGKCGLFFTPEDEKELAANIIKLKYDKVLCKTLGENGKAYVNANFDRQKIAQAFYQELIKL